MILITLCHYTIWFIKNLCRIYNKTYSQKMNVWWKKDRFRSDKCFYRDGITTISVFNVMRFFRNSLYVTIPKTKLPKSHSLSPFFPKKSKKASFLLCNIYFVKQTTKYAFYGINKPCKISHICKAMAHFKAVFILYCYDVKLHKYYNNLPKLHLKPFLF